MTKRIFLLFILIPVHVLCQNLNYNSSEIKSALLSAGKNKEELIRVIRHFEKDSNPLKLKATYFLIANMGSHNSSDYYWEDNSNKTIHFNELEYPDLSAASASFDRIKLLNPSIHPHPITINDLSTIKSNFLIKNIDIAFQAWKNSKSYKDISFEMFCEYVLPYRASIEPLQDWRKKYSENYQWISEKSNTENLPYALKEVSSNFRIWFANSYSWGKRKEPLPRLGALQLLFRKKGPCEDIADLVVFALRSQGIPVAINYVPYWATSTGSHFFNTVFNGPSQISFDAASGQAVNSVLSREPSKVIRLTYSKQANVIAKKTDLRNIPPGFMKGDNYIDVTQDFWKTSDINMRLYGSDQKQNYAFVCVFNGLKWQPTWWGKVTDGHVIFKSMPKGAVFLPVYCIAGRVKPAGFPLAEGYHHEALLNPDEMHKITLRLKEEDEYLQYRSGKSYSLYYWNNQWKLSGKQVAGFNTHELLFPNIPKNALYLLLPEYSEGKERPFTVLEDGKILRW